MKKKKYNADLVCPVCKGTHNYDFYNDSDSETVTCQECRIVFEIYSLISTSSDLLTLNTMRY